MAILRRNALLKPMQATLQGEKLRNTTPKNFLLSRYAMLRQTQAVANMHFPLFADGAKQGDLEVTVSEPMPNGITKKDITEAVIDICRLLDLQTYQYQKDRRKQKGLAPEDSGGGGAICITLSEWAKTFFDTDEVSGSERKKARRILEYLNDATTQVTDKEGKEYKFRFIAILNEGTDPKTNTTVYWIVVNRIFSNEIDGFGKLPQDYKRALRKAKKKVKDEMAGGKRGTKQKAADGPGDEKGSKCTQTDFDVLTYLALQDKRHKHMVTMEALLQRCFLMEEYNKRRRATEQKILVAMKSAAMVLGWEVEPISTANRGKTYIYKFECVCKRQDEELLQDELPQDDNLLLGFADEQEKEKAK